ncbi:hypothetical protein VTK73DRAFT_9534 [Phialemonium thermophilum]|uniref:Glucosidase 2 subunit beta n=1 Tax=Phialemonium thermophilum TaxID=223376 RepID=A0ABR3XK64_9PEZI
MRQFYALVLLGTVAHTSFVTAGSLPRGVGPEFAKYYQGASSTFQCISHPSITIESSQINDNSCDCPDGSDEPGTAACSYLDRLSPEQPLPFSSAGSTNTTNVLPGFWCANEGHIGAYVPFMYVNDGVCDYELCCDGTEEYAHVGGVKCENRCGPIGKEWRRLDKERRDARHRAANVRQGLIKEAQDLRQKVEAQVVRLLEEIKKLEARREELKTRLEEVEKEERGKVVQSEGGGGGKLGVLLGLAKKRVQELRDTLDDVLDQRDDLQDKVEELENILKKLKEEYNPNFNDEGVKAAVHAWEDYAAKIASEKAPSVKDEDILEVLKEDGEESGINWKEFEEEEGSDADILYNFEAYLPGFAREYIHTKLNGLRTWLIDNGILADTQKSGAESKRVAAARESYQTAAGEVTSKQSQLEDAQRDLGKDYGPNDIFRALKGRCITTHSGEYEYEMCWLEKTVQKSKKGHPTTTMGTFSRIDTETADEEDRVDGKSLGRGSRMVLRYENGQGCWNGPNRRTDVWLGCAEKEEIWRVSESEKCVYRMEVGTPAACEDEAQLETRPRDEL